MKIYKIEIEEVLQKVVKVKANSEAEYQIMRTLKKLTLISTMIETKTRIMYIK